VNPSSPKPGPTLVRDVTSPSSINAEIVSDIPVKSPLGLGSSAKPQPANSPLAKVFKPSTGSPPISEDKELDHILRDVNSSVKQSEKSARFENLSGVRKKVAVKKAKLNEAHNGSPPIAATIVACLVALLLSAAAVFVYREGF
jgi:hypothetical protein